MLSIHWLVLWFIISISVMFGYALAAFMFAASRGDRENE
jgi:heme/copper-type cytochrome/quinol oxidase subunit 3